MSIQRFEPICFGSTLLAILVLGCGFKTRSTTVLEVHEAKCGEGVYVRCPDANNCSAYGMLVQYKELIGHLVGHLRLPLTHTEFEVECSYDLAKRLRDSHMVTLHRGITTQVLQYLQLGKDEYLFLMIHESQVNEIFIWIYRYATRDQATKHELTCEIQVFPSQEHKARKSLTYVGPCLSIQKPVEEVVSERDCLVMSPALTNTLTLGNKFEFFWLSMVLRK